MPDEFSSYYADLLDSGYDCVDRIVLNGYFRLGYSPGAFRTWWRHLHQGSDADLDNVHLMRLADRMGWRVRGWAQANHVPVIYFTAGKRKDDQVPEYLPTSPDSVGVFLVLAGRVPAPIWDVTCSSKGHIVELSRKRAQVNHYNHYTFHILDPE
jgi:hypothetical protein